MSTGGLQI